MYRLIGAGIAALSIAGTGFAGEYRGEFLANYSYSEPYQDLDTSDPEVEAASVGINWYFNPVDTSKGPLGEAAFLDHASGIKLGYGETQAESNSDNPANETEQDRDSYSVNVRKVFDNAGDWVLALSYTEAEQDNEFNAGSSKTTTELEGYSVSVSKYVQAHTEVGVTRSRYDLEYSSGNQSYEINQMGLFAKTVRECGCGGFFSLWGSAARQYSDTASEVLDGSIIQVGGSYFPTTGLEIGAELFRNSSRIFENGDLDLVELGPVGHGYALKAEYFIIPQASVALRLSQSEADVYGNPNSDFDAESAAIRGTFRF